MVSFKPNKRKSSYKILQNKQLVVEKLSNTISPNEYSNLKVKEFQDKKFSRTYDLITDLTSFNDSTDTKTIEDLFIVFKENKGKFIRNKSALVISNPGLLKKINAIIKKGNAIIGVNFQVTPIRDPIKNIIKEYKITCTGSVVLANGKL